MNAFRTVFLILILGACCGLTANAYAQASTSRKDPSWAELSAAQQRVLANFEKQWAELPPPRRASLARGAERWISMNPENR